jgi:hypothetical protein
MPHHAFHRKVHSLYCRDDRRSLNERALELIYRQNSPKNDTP